MVVEWRHLCEYVQANARRMLDITAAKSCLNAGSLEERMVAEGVCERRLQMARTLNNVLMIVQLVVCINMQVNIAMENEDRWASASLSWMAIVALGLLCGPFLCSSLLKAGTLDVWYVSGSLLVLLAQSPVFTTYHQSIRMSRLLVGLFRIPATTVSTRPWLVVLCNLGTACLMLLVSLGIPFRPPNGPLLRGLMVSITW